MNANTQFVFETKQKQFLIGGILLGAICLIASYFGDDEYHTRFWSNILQNSVYFTGIAFTAIFFLCAQITAFGGWNTVVKRVWEAMGMFMGPGLVLMGILAAGVWGHFHHLYHWNTPGITDPSNPIFDKIIAGKAGFLNPTFYTIATIGFLAIWFFWAINLRKTSIAQDTLETPSFDYHKKSRKWAASFLPLGGFLSCVFLWQSIMSVDPHWYSTMYAWYSMISMLLGATALTIMLIIYLKSKGYMEYVTNEHMHDLGKFLFGFSVFWTYLWFDQFMLIWYANNGEETIYFKLRMNHYPVLFWGNLLLNFVTPFLILMRNDTKRKFGTLFFVSLIVFFGHWWDYFYMVKPGARTAAHEAKEISEGKFGKKHEAAPMGEVHNAAADQHATAAPAAEAHAEGHTPATAEGHGAESAHTPTESAHTPEASHVAEASTHAEGEGEHAAHGEEHGDGEPTSFKIGYTIPGLLEIGILIGFLSFFLFWFFRNLEKASLVPLKDPYLEESLHHQTGVYIDGEAGADNHH